MWKTQSLADQVYERLLREMSAGDLTAGSPLRELDLVVRLGVSRTPIREALARLAENGLVEVRPNRTTYVRRLSRNEILHVYQVRQALEGVAVRRACGRLTAADFAHLEALVPRGLDVSSPEFDAACQRLDLHLHGLIVERSENHILAEQVRKLHDLIQLPHRCTINRRGRLELEVQQHLEIIAALKAQDPQASRQALRAHLRSACAFLLRCTSRQPATAEASGGEQHAGDEPGT